MVDIFLLLFLGLLAVFHCSEAALAFKYNRAGFGSKCRI